MSFQLVWNSQVIYFLCSTLLIDRKRCHAVHRCGRSGYSGDSWEVRTGEHQPPVTSQPQCYLRLFGKQSWLPDSDVSFHLGCCQRDRKGREQDTPRPHRLDRGVRGRAAKISSSCSAEFCPLETDIHPVNMSLTVSQFRLELWSQRWRASISSTKPFSLFLWGKIDFKKAINLSDLSH